MANVFLTRKQLENLFWTTTEQMLGFDPTLTANASKVRISWPTYGAPTYKITEDVTFIRVGDQDDPINIQRDTLVTPVSDDIATLTTKYTRVIAVHWTICGPNSYDNAFLIRNNLYNQSIHDNLAAKNIYIITEIATPVRSPELFEDQWWERTNISARFNEFISMDTAANFIQTPSITVNSDKI